MLYKQKTFCSTNVFRSTLLVAVFPKLLICFKEMDGLKVMSARWLYIRKLKFTLAISQVPVFLVRFSGRKFSVYEQYQDDLAFGTKLSKCCI